MIPEMAPKVENTTSADMNAPAVAHHGVGGVGRHPVRS